MCPRAAAPGGVWWQLLLRDTGIQQHAQQVVVELEVGVAHWWDEVCSHGGPYAELPVIPVCSKVSKLPMGLMDGNNGQEQQAGTRQTGTTYTTKANRSAVGQGTYCI